MHFLSATFSCFRSAFSLVFILLTYSSALAVPGSDVFGDLSCVVNFSCFAASNQAVLSASDPAKVSLKGVPFVFTLPSLVSFVSAQL